MLLLFFISDDVWARSVKSIAEKLNGEVARIGIIMASIGIVVGGVALAIGRQDAGRLVTCSMIGSLIILMQDSIINFLRSMV